MALEALRTHPFPALACVAWILVATGCKGSAVESDDTAEGTGIVELGDAHNFTYTAVLSMGRYPVMAFADLHFSWNGLTTDMLGLPVATPGEITTAALVMLNDMSAEEVEAAIANGTLQQTSVGIYVSCAPVKGACELSDFTLFGTDIGIVERFEPGLGSWVLLLVTDEEAGPGYRTMAVLEPSEQEKNTEVAVVNGDTTLQVSADFEAAVRVAVPEGNDFTFDWSGLTTDSRGNELPLHRLDRLEVARFDGFTTEELGDRFAEIDGLATERWVVDVTGRVSLDAAEMEGFSGLEAGGTWMMALWCTTCTTPVPSFMAVMDPEAGR